MKRGERSLCHENSKGCDQHVKNKTVEVKLVPLQNKRQDGPEYSPNH